MDADKSKASSLFSICVHLRSSAASWFSAFFISLLVESNPIFWPTASRRVSTRQRKCRSLFSFVLVSYFPAQNSIFRAADRSVAVAAQNEVSEKRVKQELRQRKQQGLLRRDAFHPHCSLAYSALACLRIGTSESASFQSVRKSL